MLEVHAILQRQRCNENITKKTGTLSDAYERFKQKPFRIYDVEGASLPIVAEGYMKYGKPE